MEITYSLAQIDEVARQFVEYINENSGISVFYFDAPMGSGKTTLIKAICKELNIEDQVSSPTFSLVNEYAGNQPVFHFDLYRIESPEELYNIGFEDYLEREGLKFIEWPEHARDFVESHQTVTIDVIDDTTRKISVN